jgi:hypothetical protein
MLPGGCASLHVAPFGRSRYAILRDVTDMGLGLSGPRNPQYLVNLADPVVLTLLVGPLMLPACASSAVVRAAASRGRRATDERRRCGPEKRSRVTAAAHCWRSRPRNPLSTYLRCQLATRAACGLGGAAMCEMAMAAISSRGEVSR